MASHDGDSQSRPVDLPVSFKTNACVKKVVDFKYYNGQRLYKVKWESTWEPEENLLEYQNLLDQFWGFIKRVQLEDNCGPVHKKARLENSHDGRQLKDALETPTCKSHSLTPKINCLPTFKIDSENSLGSQIHSNNAEGQIEVPKEETIICTTINPVADINFTRDVNDLTLYWDNPYVRIGFFCRLCNDEQPFSHDEKKWRQHFLTHIRLRPQLQKIDDDVRKFQCSVCHLAFKRRDMLVRHSRTHSKEFCYFCAVCEKGFIRRYVLVRHLEKEHHTADESLINSTKRIRGNTKKDGSQSSDEMIKLEKVDENINQISMVSRYSNNHETNDVNQEFPQHLENQVANQAKEDENEGVVLNVDLKKANSVDVNRRHDDNRMEVEIQNDKEEGPHGSANISLKAKKHADLQFVLVKERDDTRNITVSSMIDLESILKEAATQANISVESSETTEKLQPVDVDSSSLVPVFVLNRVNTSEDIDRNKEETLLN